MASFVVTCISHDTYCLFQRKSNYAFYHVAKMFIEKPAPEERPLMVLGPPNSNTAEPVAMFAKEYYFTQVG